MAKQIIHFKSDITTSMGLPAPLMGLFNLLQFGSIGEEEQTIAEIVRGMYYEGDAYIRGQLYDDLKGTCFMIDRYFEEFSAGYIVILEGSETYRNL